MEESVRYGLQIEKLLLEEFPNEIRDVWSRTGTAEIATDPMGLELTDVFITLTPRASWQRAKTQAELVGVMEAELAGMPAMRDVEVRNDRLGRPRIVLHGKRTRGLKIFISLSHVESVAVASAIVMR